MHISGGIDTKVRGLIQMQVKHKDGSMTDTGWFPNLVLDTFFARFAANNNMFIANSQCRVGTGSTTPANSDTALASQVAAITATTNSDVVGTIDVPNNRVVAAIVRQFEFLQGSVVANLAEVGFEFAPGTGGVSSGALNSRSLIKDSFGTPTPLTVTADDQLIVNYRFEVWIPTADYVGTVVLAGITYDVIGRVALNFSTTAENLLRLPIVTSSWFRSYASTSVFGAHGIDPTVESGTAGNTQTNFLSLSGGKEVEMTGTINQMNATGGIKCITIPHGSGGSRLYKYQFTPVIPKTALKVLKLRFRMTCARA